MSMHALYGFTNMQFLVKLVLCAGLLGYINEHVVRTILLCVLIMRLKFTWVVNANDCTVGPKLGPLVLTLYTALEHFCLL